MRVVCAPLGRLPRPKVSELQVALYGRADREGQGEVGATLLHVLQRSKLRPSQHAWDLLSIALAVTAADTGIRRDTSPDGWTREIDLQVAVNDSDFWTVQRALLEKQLRFLTTDLWHLSFTGNGMLPAPPREPVIPESDCVALLSGGMDSLVGAIDLTRREHAAPYFVSQVAHGDKDVQARFARQVGRTLSHLQLNHNANCPGSNERSQRARSLVFLAYGVLVATTLQRYQDGETVTLNMSENGFISINPPLTPGRIGSLSTRTTHPVFLGLFQTLLDVAVGRVRVHNPYQFHTKGEMLAACSDQALLRKNAHLATSCSRYGRYNFTHCGRCVPCLVRRAAFHAWGYQDRTDYWFDDLSQDDPDYAGFDDVRSAAMAVAQVRSEGIDTWLGTALSSALLGDVTQYRDTVARGLEEIGAFLDAARVI